mmetsp:Transcript_29276/g.38483  ORF Transcript_29276/g.38483 Transcript_29276/m.38483 type:complete len:1281 (+) Transcript_29276:241-4083(+)
MINMEKERDNDLASSGMIPSASSASEMSTTVSRNTHQVQGKISLQRIFHSAGRIDKLIAVVGLAHSIAAGTALSIIIVQFGELIDLFGSGSDMDNFSRKINQLCLMMVYVALGLWYGVFVSNVCWGIFGDKQAFKMKKEYVRSILRQDITWFDEENALELPTKVTTATEQIQAGIGCRLGYAIQYLAQFISLYVVGFLYSWQVALVVMALFPLVVLSVLYLQHVTKQKDISDDENYASAGAVATEAISSIKTIFSLNAQKQELARYSNFLKTAEKAGVYASLLIGLGAGVMNSTQYLVQGVGFWFGAELRAKQIENGCLEDSSQHCITGGEVMVVFFAILFGSVGVGQAGPSFKALAQALRAAETIFSTIDRVPEIDALSQKGKTLQQVKGELTFKEVRFSYSTRPDNIVCNQLSLTMMPGKSMALVGPSGGGKSTLMSLILRFYDPQGGRILLDGVDIRDINLGWYRSQIGYVGQEPVLFAGSILQNIKHAKPSASMEDIISAAKAANAHEFIMKFPQGYRTNVGEAGGQISGGQKQRIAIARALIKQPRILLLDEATSALDNESEQVVQQTLDEIMENLQLTTVIIAHRLTTIQNCDCIAVIADGCIAQLGTHTELISNPYGKYAKLAAQKASTEKKVVADSMMERNTTCFAGNEDFVPLSQVQENLPFQQILPSSDLCLESDIESTEKQQKQSVWIGRLLPMASEKRKHLLTGCLGCVVVGGFFPIRGLLMAKAQVMFYTDSPQDLRYQGMVWGLGFFLFAAVYVLGSILRSYGLSTFEARLTLNIRNKFFEAIMNHSVPWFERKENNAGALVEQLAVDLTKIHVMAGGVMGALINLFFALLVGLALAFYFSWEISLAMLATIPILTAGSKIRTKIKGGTQISASRDSLETEAGSTVTAAIQGIRTIQAFGMQPIVLGNYTSALEEQDVHSKRKALANGFFLGFGQSQHFLVFALLFYVGGALIQAGRLTLNDMLISIFVLISVSTVIGDSAILAGDQNAGREAADHVFAFLESEENLEPSNGQIFPITKGHIEFQAIRFAYPQRPDMRVHDGFSLTVPGGATVALCGPSGSGKSTVMGLLLRFYSPQEGFITIDGKDIRDINIQVLRRQIGYVGQEPVLFRGSIRSNIALGAESVTEESLVHAAKIALAHEFVLAFQNGYDTDVGNNSALLSGGQKQRLAIARALVKEPKILLLDEATSALDNNSEQQVREALDNIQHQKGLTMTMLIIAHRLSTIQNADKIAVMDSGCVVETGTHSQLMTAGGLYQSMTSIQTSN